MKTLEREEGTQQAQRETFQPKDLLKQVVIAALAVSPDGESVVYVKRTVENGKYARRLWRTTFKGGEPEQLTAANASDMRPRFSPDGKQLVFISDRSGKPQAWVMSTGGGEPKQLSDLPGGVSAAEWSPDGTKIALGGGSGVQRFIAGKEDDPTARRIRDYTWRLDGAGIRDEYASVWITDVEDPKPIRITEPDYGVDAFAWSPDSKTIAFMADRSDSRGLEEIDSLWTVDVGGGQPRVVARLRGGLMSMSWAPGREIAFTGTDQHGTPGWAEVELHVAGGGQQPRRLAAERHLDVHVTAYGDYQDAEQFPPFAPAWLDPDNIVTLVAAGGFSHPYRFGLDGSVEALATPDATCSSIAAGGGRVAVIAATADHPNDVFAVENGRLRRLTSDGSSWYGPFARESEHLAIRHKEGHEIEGWLLPAHGTRTRAPLVIDVHGGPHSAFGPTPWLEANALADAGIHVIYSNPRGSAGYGEKFGRDLEGRWGDPDGSDLMMILDWAVEQGLTDRERIGIMGLSYGGFMTNYMLANHPGVFKAAVSENPVTDLLGEWATSDFGRFIARRAIEVQSPWEDIDRFVTRSPFYRMHENHAPLLLLQAENDMRCPPGNSDMVFHILRTLGRDVEMIRYPAESHVMLAIGRPDRRVDRLERIVDWFKKHLDGA